MNSIPKQEQLELFDHCRACKRRNIEQVLSHRQQTRKLRRAHTLLQRKLLETRRGSCRYTASPARKPSRSLQRTSARWRIWQKETGATLVFTRAAEQGKDSSSTSKPATPHQSAGPTSTGNAFAMLWWPR